MNNVAFGNTILNYSIRLSPKAQKKRIEITPYSIEVVAPESSSESDIDSFMQEKVKDVFIAQTKLKQKNTSFFHETDQFFSGGKISFRGRRLMVCVDYAEIEKPVLSFKSRFNITFPKSLNGQDNTEIISQLIGKWLDTRLYEDSQEIALTLGKPLGLQFKRVRVREQKNIWATCGHDGILYINRLLVKAPKKVLEYVVAHELAHLTHRNHSQSFWSFVEKMVPDYQVYQDILDSW
jgi:predicted metal-dependent hydrolase